MHLNTNILTFSISSKEPEFGEFCIFEYHLLLIDPVEDSQCFYEMLINV